MTLTNEDYLSPQPRYAWRCASCNRIFMTNRSPEPGINADNPDDDPVRDAYGYATPPDALMTKNMALMCCAPRAVSMPATHNGQWYRPRLDANPAQVRWTAQENSMVRVVGARERAAFVQAFDAVPLGHPEVIYPGHHKSYQTISGWLGDQGIDVSHRIDRVRVDIAFDEDPTKQAPLWLSFLAASLVWIRGGLRQHPSNGQTFITHRTTCSKCAQEPAEEGEFGVLHAYAHLTAPLLVPTRQMFAISFAYAYHREQKDAQELPVAYMRLTAEGVAERDVQ